MFHLFYAGGPLFMSILTLELLLLLFSAFKLQEWVKEIGILALATGILGQIIGLYAAFEAIEAAADISPAMLAGGLKVSLITTIYGLLIFVISLLIRLATKPRIRQN